MSAVSLPIAAQPRRLRFEASSVFMVALVAVLGFVTLYPILAIVGNGLALSRGWQDAFATPGVAQSVLNTLKVVGTVQLISFPIAIVISWLIARTDLPGGRWLEFGFWISFLLPALGTTTGWLLLFAPDYGLVNSLIRKAGLASGPVFDMYTFWGIIFMHLATYSISVKVMLMVPAFRNLDASLEEASWVCGGGKLRTLVRVVAPALAPIIVVTFLMALIKSLEAFEIELVLGARTSFSVYSTKIYQLLQSSPPDYGSATVLGLAILALMVALIILQRVASGGRSYTTMSGRFKGSILELGAWRWPALAAVVGLLLFLTVTPLILQVMGSMMALFGFFDVPQVWTLKHWQRVLTGLDFTRALVNTLVLGGGSAVAAVAGYSIVAYCSARVRHSWKHALDLLSWLPFTIPGVLLGLGYLWMILQVPLFRPLYGTMAILILVSWLASITMGAQVIKSNMVQLGADLEEAGRVAGGSWWRIFRGVVARLTAPSMAVVAVIVFAVTTRQVSTIVLLSTGRTRPLSLLQLEYLYGSELGPAAVTGTVIVLLSLAAAAAALLISPRAKEA